MPRLKLILNPQADRGDTGGRSFSIRDLVDTARAECAEGQTYELVWETTESPEHAIALARSAGEEGFDGVVAIGGDGTVHEVVNGLMQIEANQRPVLGILPVGSGNDFAFNIGVPHKTHEAAWCLFSGVPRTVDAGMIRDDKGRMRYWDNSIGVGFSGAVNIASRKKTRLRGFLLYFVAVLETILFKPPALDARYQTNSHSNNQRAISMLGLCNGPREGGGFPTVPDAQMDDGLISYVILRKQSRLGMLFYLPIVMAAQHPRFTKDFEFGTTTRFEIETDQTMAIHTDGETFGPWEADIHKIEVEIVPGALRVLIPKT